MTSDWVALLGAESEVLGRSSTAGRVADLLRAHITQGRLSPGTRLSEEEIGSALGVSRNTLREAFRLLTHERLLVHEFNRGVFVRRLDADDVRDLYAFRRILECGAIRQLAESGRPAPSAPLAAIRAAVDAGESAARAGDWVEVGTANMQFHQALVTLAGSDRVDEAMRHVLAELRLVFHAMEAAQTFHEPYLADNRLLLEMLASGELAEAESALRAYLDKAESQLVAAVS